MALIAFRLMSLIDGPLWAAMDRSAEKFQYMTSLAEKHLHVKFRREMLESSLHAM